jgi:hypothetical protein
VNALSHRSHDTYSHLHIPELPGNPPPKRLGHAKTSPVPACSMTGFVQDADIEGKLRRSAKGHKRTTARARGHIRIAHQNGHQKKLRHKIAASAQLGSRQRREVCASPRAGFSIR